MGLAAWLGYAPRPPKAVVRWQQPVDLAAILDGLMRQPVDKLWREQPHLRTVVDFIARNIAQLGLHVYERDAHDGRNRVRDGPLTALLAHPNADTTPYELIRDTVGSMCLYDNAFWLVGQDRAAPSGWFIRHIPSTWIIGTIGQGAFGVERYKVALPHAAAGQWMEIPAKEMIVFHGWNPTDPTSGVSPVHALKAVLAEQIHAQAFRDQMWNNGGRVGTYLTRPADAPDWSSGGDQSPRSRFIAQWKDSYAGDSATNGGGTPLLEDGMELKSIAFNPRESQWSESVKLSLETVAQVFQVNPTMVGVLDNANYSNVREFRRMLYGDTLGPWLIQFEQRINATLVPMILGRSGSEVYTEFNIQSKLTGSFEEQGAVMQQAIGSPWMTVNEGRARLNMSSVDGGNGLVRPLNVTQNGDQNPIPAAPADPEAEAPAVPPKKNGVAVHV